MTRVLDRGHRPGGTREERNRLIEEHIGLARHLARRYARNADDREELEQVANLALVGAADRFDRTRGDFARFAFTSIVGEIKKFRRDASWNVRVPRRLQEALLDVEAARDGLTQSLGRAPTAREVSRETGRDVEEVLEALEVGLTQFLSTDDGTDVPAEAGSDRVIDHVALADAMKDLDDEDTRILRLLFGQELTQRQAGRIIGTSQTHVHRHLSRIVGELRSRMDPEAASRTTTAPPTEHDPDS